MSKRKYFNYLDVKSLLDKMLSTEIKDEERQLDTAQTIKELSKGIKHLRKQGYTFAQIENFFKESGLDISRRTIESYVSPKKTSQKAQNRKSGTRKEPDRTETNLQKNQTEAIKNEETFTKKSLEEISQEESSSIERAVTDTYEVTDNGRLEDTQKINTRPGRFTVRPDTIDL